MTTAAARLEELGVKLPAVSAPLASYVPAKRLGSALYVSGQVERALGNKAKAIEVFNRALLNSNGTLVTALIQLGQLYEETGDDQSAIQSYRTYLSAAPEGPAAAFARSRLEALGASG